MYLCMNLYFSVKICRFLFELPYHCILYFIFHVLTVQTVRYILAVWNYEHRIKGKPFSFTMILVTFVKSICCKVTHVCMHARMQMHTKWKHDCKGVPGDLARTYRFHSDASVLLTFILTFQCVLKLLVCIFYVAKVSCFCLKFCSASRWTKTIFSGIIRLIIILLSVNRIYTKCCRSSSRLKCFFLYWCFRWPNCLPLVLVCIAILQEVFRCSCSCAARKVSPVYSWSATGA